MKQTHAERERIYRNWESRRLEPDEEPEDEEIPPELEGASEEELRRAKLLMEEYYMLSREGRDINGDEPVGYWAYYDGN